MCSFINKFKKRFKVLVVLCVVFNSSFGFLIPLTTTVPNSEEHSKDSLEISEEWNQNITYDDFLNLKAIFNDSHDFDENLESIKKKFEDDDFYENTRTKGNISERSFILLPARSFKSSPWYAKAEKRYKQSNKPSYKKESKPDFFRGRFFHAQVPYSNKIPVLHYQKFPQSILHSANVLVNQKKIVNSASFPEKANKPIQRPKTVKYNNYNPLFLYRDNGKPFERSKHNYDYELLNLFKTLRAVINSNENKTDVNEIKSEESSTNKSMLLMNSEGKTEHNDKEINEAIYRKLIEGNIFEFAELLRKPLLRPEKNHLKDEKNDITKHDKIRSYRPTAYKDEFHSYNVSAPKATKNVYRDSKSLSNLISSISNYFKQKSGNKITFKKKKILPEFLSMKDEKEEIEFENPLLLKEIEEIKRLQENADSESQEVIENNNCTKENTCNTYQAQNSNKMNSRFVENLKCVYPECELIVNELYNNDHLSDFNLGELDSNSDENEISKQFQATL